MDQGDVSVFRPVGTAEYKDNVSTWRQLILDRFCDTAWVCLPDLDEFLYFRAVPSTLPQVARSLDMAGEEALMGIMVDMYADGPIALPAYDGSIPIRDAYPLFDGQGYPPH